MTAKAMHTGKRIFRIAGIGKHAICTETSITDPTTGQIIQWQQLKQLIHNVMN